MPRKQNGGSMEIAELAIPFGLILAQRGLTHLFSAKPKQKGGAIAHNCALCNSVSIKKQSTANGGGSCGKGKMLGGGRGDIASMIVRNEFRNLSKQLSDLLKNAS